MEKSLYQIFKTFFKVGTLLLGGGYVILPLLQSELVDKKHRIVKKGVGKMNVLVKVPLQTGTILPIPTSLTEHGSASHPLPQK